MPLHVSSYEQGIDRDSSKNKYPKGSYYKMKNFRLISFEELSNGTVTSIKGNSAITISGATNADDIVIGYTVIRNYLVVWSTNCHDTTGGRGTIWRTDLSVASPAWTKIYENASMMLTTKYPIMEEVIGYYESSTIIKVYWTDNFNMFRFINILGSAPSSVDQIDILSGVTLAAPTVETIGNGNIYVGKIQYAYQLYNIGGSETVFSPATPLIHLTKSSEGLTGSNIRLYEGSPALDDSGNPNNSGKSVTINLGTLDSDYGKVRVVAILYRNLDQTPDIHIVGEYDVSNGIIITDYGVYSKGTLTLNAFRTLGNGELYCKTISQKGNKALIGNITENFFDIDFDARVYRFKSLEWMPDPIPAIRLYNSLTGVEDWVGSTGAWPNQTFTIGGNPIDEEHDCINPYNYDHLFGAELVVPAVTPKIDEPATYTAYNDFTVDPLSNEPYNSNSYKWQSDLTTIGGEGPNIKYEFVSDTLVVNVTTNSNGRYTEPATIYREGFDSYKNPLVELTLMDYKHDEVYRHGIVLTNNRGQDSFVKWIGDIKTPTQAEFRTVQSPGSPTCYIKPLGIKFTVNTAVLTSDIVGFRIVRVERKEEDRTILTQGIASCMFYNDRGVAGNYEQMLLGFPRATIKTPTEGTDAAYYKIEKSVVQFISPEINYFKDLSPQTGDYIKAQSKLNVRKTYLSRSGWLAANTIDVDGTVERSTILGGGVNTFASTYNSYGWVNFSTYYNTGLLTELKCYNITDGVLAGLVESGGHSENAISLASSPSGLTILNRSIDYNPGRDVIDHEGISGTCSILTLDADIDDTELVTTDEHEILLFDYKRPGIAASQYGGLTYEARKYNTYIQCGSYVAVTFAQQVNEVYGGDTFIGFHEHLRTMWEVDDNDGDTNADVTYTHRFCAVVSYPCESAINLELDHGYRFSKHYTNYRVQALKEDAGTYNGDFIDHTLPNDDYDLIQDENMYEYNTVYSQQNISKVYFCKPSEWLATVHDDTLVKISLEKSAREITDSYTKFLTDNEKTLPTQFGPVNDLFLFKNYMIVFFDHAFGSLSIDERALLPIQNNSILELGAGNNLQYFDFISDQSGSTHPTSIKRIGKGFGWFDASLNAFGYYNGETQDLGLVKGISSEIKAYSDRIKSASLGTYYNNQLYGGNFITVENKKYKESYCAMIVSELAVWLSSTGTTVTFTLAYSPVSATVYNIEVCINGVEYFADITTTQLAINTTDNVVLNPASYTAGRYFIYYKEYSKIFSFSSVLNSFRHEVDMFPTHLLEYNDNLFEFFYKMVVYKANEGNYGEFYGIYRYGEIEFIINPQKSLVCLFNNHEYAMEAIDSNGINQVAETWDVIKLSNDYQYSRSSGVTCTYVEATQTFNTVAAHGLTNNQEMMLSGTIPTGLSTIVKYYLIAVTANSWKLSLTKGGTAVAFTGTSTCNYNILDIPLTVGVNVKRRMRSWRIKDLRDRGIGKPRMRDTYLRLMFKYLHGSNKRIVMHDLYTYYTVTRESMNQGQ